MVRVLGSGPSVPGSIPGWEFDLMGIANIQIGIFTELLDYLVIMCGLHDITPSLNECMFP